MFRPKARHALLLAACVSIPMLSVGAGSAACWGTSTGLPPLTDLGPRMIHGQQGGLYPGGSNIRPADWTAVGKALTNLMVPRTLAGTPDPKNGMLVFMSVGMSNNRDIFSSFIGQAMSDPVRDPRVRAFNGGIGGMTSDRIANPLSAYWIEVDQRLLEAGLSPLQVAAVWLYDARPSPTGPPIDHARAVESDLAAIIAIMHARYPNLAHVYVSSREYAGYASIDLHPEPYAWVTGFAVKWLVEDQIQLTTEARSRDNAVVPWVSWGPYTWADGLRGRADGLRWACDDFSGDGTHPSPKGAYKAASQILAFLHQDPVARAWYAG